MVLRHGAWSRRGGRRRSRGPAARALLAEQELHVDGGRVRGGRGAARPSTTWCSTTSATRPGTSRARTSRRMRVRHLLTMTTGHDEDPTPRVQATDDWVTGVPRAARRARARARASSTTRRRRTCSRRWSSRLTGQRLLDYLQPAAVRAARHRGRDVGAVADGRRHGRLRHVGDTEDIAALGLLYLQDGSGRASRCCPRVGRARRPRAGAERRRPGRATGRRATGTSSGGPAGER